MSNNHELVKCSNPEVMKAFALVVKHLNGGEEDYNASDADIYATMEDYVTRQEIIEISKKFPDDIIICRYKYEPTIYYCVYITAEYLNGASKKVDIEPSYWFSRINVSDTEKRIAIYDKAKFFFRKLDTKETDEEGNIFINWCNDDVCYKFIYYDNGKIYQVEARKDRALVDLKVYESCTKEDWREINSGLDTFDDHSFSEARN